MRISNFYCAALILTPLSYMLSAILDYKLNYLMLGVLYLLSMLITFKYSRSDFLWLASAAGVAIIMYARGSSGTESYMAFLIGFAAFNASVFVSQTVSYRGAKASVFIPAFWVLYSVVIALVFMQFFGLVPTSLGELEYSNVTRLLLLGGDSLYVRPNGFFYHPFELCLFLSGFLSYLISSGRNLTALLLYIPLSLVIFLKSWLLACFVLLSKTMMSALGSKMVTRFLSALVFLGFVVFIVDIYHGFGDAVFSGRLGLWEAYISIYKSSYSLFDYLLGPVLHPLVHTHLWVQEYIPGAHNQILGFLVFWGGFGLFFCIVLVFRLYRSYKTVMAPEFRVIALVFVTLGITGEPFSSPLLWVSLASSRVARCYG